TSDLPRIRSLSRRAASCLTRAKRPARHAGPPHPSEEQFRAVFESGLIAITILDDERRYRDANEAACELLGVTKDELLRIRLDDVTPPEARHRLDELWRSFVATGEQAGSYL